MPEDWELLDAWRRGDRQAGGALVDRHFAAISRFFRNKVTSEHDAADLVSQTFLACTEGKDGFRGETSFRRYLYAIALNLLRAYIRKKQKRSLEALDFERVCIGDLDPSSMSSIVARRRESQLVVQALREIPVDFQVVLELSIFEDLSGREIGELLGIPEGTVRGRLRLGKERLRERVRLLAASSREAESTLADFEGWAQEIRESLQRAS
ncbi:MAG: RNA polymerase sigma factor [Myxococcales bacterium]|nr:RNA polymerase sigma factor [Myxococcales bacterium]MCB9570259.1 RNA polymerase sigma factor [Myxococcales bacterium]MCB9705253.1 RNA polymerase sigma factor [Myxococcales bacterium]